MTRKELLNIAIIGAGPVGIEAALIALNLGFNPTIYESSNTVGANILRWGHVQMFSPWAMNTSPAGRKILAASSVAKDTDHAAPLESNDVYPTGAEFVASYLEPLGKYLESKGVLKLNHSVVGVGRQKVLKNQAVGRRNDFPGFNILINDLADDKGNQLLETSDVLIDASGCYGDVVAPGPSGLTPLGYSQVAPRIRTDIFDPQNSSSISNAKRILVVGSGSSAATTLSNLLAYNQQRKKDGLNPIQIVWYVNSAKPLPPIENDSLPLRRRLSDFANSAATGHFDEIQTVVGEMIFSIHESEHGTLNVVRTDGAADNDFDEVFLHTGFCPNQNLLKELQIHYCYASDGPMALAASLLATAGDGPADCLAQAPPGLGTLKTTEPDAYVLGAKSYGRTPTFLLKFGYEQVELVLNSYRNR